MRIPRPTIGRRTLLSAISAALCALIYELFLDRSPAFACIGAIFGMGSDMEDAKRHGFNRLFGTLIGGLLGMALFRIYLIFKPDGGQTILLVPLTFIGVLLLIVLCQLFWVGGVQPGVVVLMILLYNTPPHTYISYALYRIWDTGIGVLISMLICFLVPSDWQPSLPGRRGKQTAQQTTAKAADAPKQDVRDAA